MRRLGDELAVRMQHMDPAPELQLKERRGYPCRPRACRSRCRPRCGSAKCPSASPSTGRPGEPLDHGSISRSIHTAETRAGFLRALHGEEPAEAPITTDRGAQPRVCADGFDDNIQADSPDGIAADVRAVWDDAVAAQEWEDLPVGCTAATSIPRMASHGAWTRWPAMASWRSGFMLRPMYLDTQP